MSKIVNLVSALIQNDVYIYIYIFSPPTLLSLLNSKYLSRKTASVLVNRFVNG